MSSSRKHSNPVPSLPQPACFHLANTAGLRSLFIAELGINGRVLPRAAVAHPSEPRGNILQDLLNYGWEGELLEVSGLKGRVCGRAGAGGASPGVTAFGDTLESREGCAERERQGWTASRPLQPRGGSHPAHAFSRGSVGWESHREFKLLEAQRVEGWEGHGHGHVVAPRGDLLRSQPRV